MELRKDYLLDRYVIIATNRGKRPSDFKEQTSVYDNLPKFDERCPFCPGNEDKTPKETYRLMKNGQWSIRCVENKFPAVNLNDDYVIRTDNTFYTYSSAYGQHEIIIETPLHNKQLWDFNVDELEELFNVYEYRVKSLYSIKGVKYVALFKNHGRNAGTSLVHSHSQVIAYNLIPFWIRELLKANDKLEGCGFCRVLNYERNSLRSILETENFITFTPYASQFPFEVTIFPKRHVRFFWELRNAYSELALHFKKILGKLRDLKVSYNIMWLNSPLDYDLHFHIRIVPRITKPGGFEFFGTHINVILPEDAAKFYRG